MILESKKFGSVELPYIITQCQLEAFYKALREGGIELVKMSHAEARGYVVRVAVQLGWIKSFEIAGEDARKTTWIGNELLRKIGECEEIDPS